MLKVLSIPVAAAAGGGNEVLSHTLLASPPPPLLFLLQINTIDQRAIRLRSDCITFITHLHTIWERCRGYHLQTPTLCGRVSAAIISDSDVLI